MFLDGYRLHHLQHVTVGVANQKARGKWVPRLIDRDDSGRYERCLRREERRSKLARVGAGQDRLPVNEIVGALVRRHRAATSGREVLQELDPGSRSRAERRDAEPGAAEVV